MKETLWDVVTLTQQDLLLVRCSSWHTTDTVEAVKATTIIKNYYHHYFINIFKPRSTKPQQYKHFNCKEIRPDWFLFVGSSRDVEFHFSVDTLELLLKNAAHHCDVVITRFLGADLLTQRSHLLTQQHILYHPPTLSAHFYITVHTYIPYDTWTTALYLTRKETNEQTNENEQTNKHFMATIQVNLRC